MRVFRFWQDVELSEVFKSSYALIPPREVDDDHMFFDEIVAAVKKTGCSWTMTRVDKSLTEKSEGLTDNDIFNHQKRDL